MNTSSLLQFAPLLLIVVLMYFMLIRPQKRKDREAREMRSSLKPGDTVVTLSGIRGRVTRIKDESIILASGPDRVRLEFLKGAVTRVEEKESSKAYRASQEDADDFDEDEGRGVAATSTSKKKPRKLGAVVTNEEVLEDQIDQIEEIEASEDAGEIDATALKEELSSEAASEIDTAEASSEKNDA